jgi:hypothetical protein
MGEDLNTGALAFQAPDQTLAKSYGLGVLLLASAEEQQYKDENSGYDRNTPLPVVCPSNN